MCTARLVRDFILEWNSKEDSLEQEKDSRMLIKGRAAELPKAYADLIPKPDMTRFDG
jgi:hypothetical protein